MEKSVHVIRLKEERDGEIYEEMDVGINSMVLVFIYLFIYLARTKERMNVVQMKVV